LEVVFEHKQLPSPESLSQATESDLRSLGMGYRAKFLVSCALTVARKDREVEGGWLESLRAIAQQAGGRERESRLLVQKELMCLAGVGRKVADCVALFSLDQSAAIPVDTHVWDIATRDYSPALLAHKSLTPAVYEAVGDVFRDRFGDKAGWAHSVLFAAELPQFRKFLPVDMQDDMKEFAAARKELKKSKKKSKINKESIDD
jgi:N-glycosylase/DNA lyase